MFQRIHVHIIHVLRKVFIVANQMFPVTLCQIPRSARRTLTAERFSFGAINLENLVLINRMRVAKSLSFCGNSTMQ